MGSECTLWVLVLVYSRVLSLNWWQCQSKPAWSAAGVRWLKLSTKCKATTELEQHLKGCVSFELLWTCQCWAHVNMVSCTEGLRRCYCTIFPHLNGLTLDLAHSDNSMSPRLSKNAFLLNSLVSPECGPPVNMNNFYMRGRGTNQERKNKGMVGVPKNRQDFSFK